MPFRCRGGGDGGAWAPLELIDALEERLSTQPITSVSCALSNSYQFKLYPFSWYAITVFCRKIYWLQTFQVIGITYVTPEFYIQILLFATTSY